MKNAMVFFLLLLLPAMLYGGEPGGFPGIENLMSPGQYRDAGLEKLTPEERDALNRWLLEYTAWEAPTIRRSNQEVKEKERSLVIKASVVGDFVGWSGKTVFKLDNGQVWRQRIDERFIYNGEDRRIEIRKNFLGFYEMTHVESGNSVGVSLLH